MRYLKARPEVIPVSLIGVDIGTSAIKVCAYSDDGRPLAFARMPMRPVRPQPGWEELDPQAVWSATRKGLRRVAAARDVQADPPLALAISASGDEAFPVDENGWPLGPCILSGDVRGAEIEQRTAARLAPRDWYRACGHIPERMDPVNRLIWWREHNPGLLTAQSRFLGWHEFITLRLTGAAVTNPTLAAKWLVYGLQERDWSAERLQDFAISRETLPAVRRWGLAAGHVHPAVARDLGLPPGMTVGVGSYDSTCSALGAGAVQAGVLGLAAGSWEVLVAPCDQPAVADKLVTGNLPVVPYAGGVPFAILAQSPNGAAVVAWAARLMHVSLARLNQDLLAAGPAPGPVAAVPHLSGALYPWQGGRDSRGALLGLTQATSPVDVVRALMESVAYELALTVASLRAAGVAAHVLRASGGGAQSAWWMQLKADLTGVPVEVADAPEPGALGAALLAGIAAGVYRSAGEAVQAVHRTARRFEPDPWRAGCHAERLDLYQQAVGALVPLNRRMGA